MLGGARVRGRSLAREGGSRGVAGRGELGAGPGHALRRAWAGQQPQAHAVNSQYGGGGGSGTRGLGYLAGPPRSLGGRLLCASQPWVEAVRLLDGPAGRPGDLGSGLDASGRGGGLAEGLQL